MDKSAAILFENPHADTAMDKSAVIFNDYARKEAKDAKSNALLRKTSMISSFVDEINAQLSLI